MAVTIVTGKINSHKTTRFIAYHQKHGGDGYASIKHMKDKNVLFYTFMKLSTKETMKSIVHTKNDTTRFNVYESMGPYIFDEEALKIVERDVLNMAKHGVNPIYLDEIGLLELNKKYFYHTIKKLQKYPIDLVLTVRAHLVDDIIKLFNFKDVTLIK